MPPRETSWESGQHDDTAFAVRKMTVLMGKLWEDLGKIWEIPARNRGFGLGNHLFWWGILKCHG